MKRVLSAQEMRQVDAAAAEHGMPSAVLMENAGAALAERALELASPRGRFLVLCGRGNSGGDGLVAARRLHARGRSVLVETLALPEVLENEPARVYRALKGSGLTAAPIPPSLPLGPGDVVIDALLGTGINRAPDENYAEAIGRLQAWRHAGAAVVAADLPSGLASDTGVALGACVTADATVAFGHLKLGQVTEPGLSRCGDLRVADIGIPAAASSVLKGPPVFLVEEPDARDGLPSRRADAHKGTFGHLLVVGGSWGKTGAAAMTAMGALRSGVGLLTVATRPEALVPVMAHAPEVMGLELVADGGLGLADLNSLLEALDGKDALVIGPGMPRSEQTPKLLAALLEELEVPCVLDADALNAFAGQAEQLKRAKGPLLLTPHPGEMARLTGRPVAEIQQDRLGSARALATAVHATVVLKGARTVIAHADGAVYVNPTGNPGMATGGMGDVLAGVCGALLAQGLAPVQAAIIGTYAHGLAGDLASQRQGQLGLTATDLIEALGGVWARWGR